MTFQWLEDLELSAGLRLSNDAKDYAAWRDKAPAATGAGPLGPSHQNPQDTVWSGDLSLRYRAAPGVQTYLRAARGFRAPSIQGRLLFGDVVTLADTETILSFEGGTKLRLWGQRLHLNMAAFHYFMQDQQLTAVGGEANFNRLVNAESTVGRGFETELTLYRLRHWRFQRDLVTTKRVLTIRNWRCRAAVHRVRFWIQPPSGTFSIDGNGLPQAPAGLPMSRCAMFSRFPNEHTSSRPRIGLTAAECGSFSMTLWNSPMIG